MKLNVKKLKLLKQKEGNGLTLTFRHNDAAGKPASGGENFTGLIHNDLYQALQAMRIHYMILIGQISVDDILQPGPEVLLKLEKCHISGYSLNDASNGSETIVLTGHYIGPRGKAIVTNTPPELLECAPEARYGWMDDLLAKLRVLKGEEDQYLEGEKRGEPIKKEDSDPQINMFKQGSDAKVTKLKFEKPDKQAAKVATKGQQPAAENVPAGDEQGNTVKLAKADPAAIRDVAAASNEELNGKAATKRGQRRGVQTPGNPGGDPINEDEA